MRVPEGNQGHFIGCVDGRTVPCSCNDPAKKAAREERRAAQAAKREQMRQAQLQKMQLAKVSK